MTAFKPVNSKFSAPLCACVIALALISCAAGSAQASTLDWAPVGGDSASVDSLAAAPEAAPATSDSIPSTSDTTAATPALPASDSSWVTTAYLENALPFAKNELPISYPQVSVAFGVAAYASALSGVDEAFGKMERVYINAGYSLPLAAPASPGAMFMATLTVWLNHVFDVACQAGQTQNTDGHVRLLGGILSGHFPVTDARNVSLQLGLGGGGSGFSFTRHYGAQVSPVDANGGYYSLESIELKGGGAYWTTQGGFTVRFGPHGAVSGLVQYVGMNDVSTTTAHAGDVSVNVSGTIIGVSFILFF